MRQLISTTLLAAVTATAASADDFHVGPARSAEQLADGQQNIIRGVVLEETADRYVIRVVGGQIQLPKSQVRRVETTALTTADIEAQERDGADDLASANQRRRERQSVQWAERRAELVAAVAERRAAEESARAASGARGQAVEASASSLILDPVLGVLRPAAAANGSRAVDQMVRNELGGVLRRQMQQEAKRLRRRLRR